MKRAKSRLIDSFLLHVEKEYITGRENSSGPEVLQEMVAALQDILNGEDTDKALHIERQAGGPSDERNFIVAMIMHAHYRADDKLVVAEGYANEWLEKTGYKRLSGRRLRDIWGQHRAEIERRESIAEMIKAIEQATAPQQKE